MLQATAARLLDDGSAAIFFRDGHSARFEPSNSGLSGSITLQAIELRNVASKVVGVYYSPNQHPVNKQPFGFNQLATDYTPEVVAAYWMAAFNFAATEFAAGKEAQVWSVVRLSHLDLRTLYAA